VLLQGNRAMRRVFPTPMTLGLLCDICPKLPYAYVIPERNVRWHIDASSSQRYRLTRQTDELLHDALRTTCCELGQSTVSNSTVTLYISVYTTSVELLSAAHIAKGSFKRRHCPSVCLSICLSSVADLTTHGDDSRRSS